VGTLTVGRTAVIPAVQRRGLSEPESESPRKFLYHCPESEHEGCNRDAGVVARRTSNALANGTG